MGQGTDVLCSCHSASCNTYLGKASENWAGKQCGRFREVDPILLKKKNLFHNLIIAIVRRLLNVLTYFCCYNRILETR